MPDHSIRPGDPAVTFIPLDSSEVNFNPRDLPVLQRNEKKHFFIFLAVAVVDVAFHAIAGVAAAATGAHMNGSAAAPRVLSLGVIGGVMRAGIGAFCALAQYATELPFPAQLLITYIGSAFGSALIITITVSDSFINETPQALLIAAAAAAVPLFLTPLASRDFDFIGVSILGFGATPLAGYVFARVANEKGYYLCKYTAGAGAGAVFASVIFLEMLLLQCSQGMQHTSCHKDSAGYTIQRQNRWGMSIYHDPDNVTGFGGLETSNYSSWGTRSWETYRGSEMRISMNGGF